MGQDDYLQNQVVMPLI